MVSPLAAVMVSGEKVREPSPTLTTWTPGAEAALDEDAAAAAVVEEEPPPPPPYCANVAGRSERMSWSLENCIVKFDSNW